MDVIEKDPGFYKYFARPIITFLIGSCLLLKLTKSRDSFFITIISFFKFKY